MPPFVSIITVSLNAAATIEDTLTSVSMQRCSFDVEHICVDGGSGDETRPIIDRWAATSSTIKRIYEPDQGIYDAMNKGLRAAGGEYVLYLNADDFLVTPLTLAAALQGLVPGDQGNPDLIVGHVSMAVLGRRGIWRHRRVPRLLGHFRGLGLFPVHQGRFVKRSLLDAVGGFDRRSRLAADVTQYYDLERRHRLVIRRFDGDVAFMRAGGAANASANALWLGTQEIYSHLRKTHGRVRAGVMALVKTLQSLSELRFGSCPHARWFAESKSLRIGPVS
jgi:glycosyltransferase involved in cell wall biosynthesis